MNQTTVKPLFCYVQAGIKLIAVSSMMVNILFLCITSHLHAKPKEASALRSISWPEIESLLSKRSFVSEEELFQLLYQLYLQQQDMIRLDKPMIQKLAGTIKSLFPLDACEAMILQNGTVRMIFNNPQDFYIPDSWLQASLRISKHLVLRLENCRKTKSPSRIINPVEKDIHCVRFIVEQGYLQLHFSFLLRIFGKNIRDGQGRELQYQINKQKQTSSLALTEVTPLTQHDFLVEKPQPGAQPDQYSWIDIRHSDFPDTKDIGISSNKMSLIDA